MSYVTVCRECGLEAEAYDRDTVCKACRLAAKYKRYWENPEKARAAVIDWRNRNVETVRQKDRLRRAARAIVFDPAAIPYAELVRQDPCVYCGGPGGTVDHIDPISRGGGGEAENLAGACLTCNVSKKDKPLLLFLLVRAA